MSRCYDGESMCVNDEVALVNPLVAGNELVLAKYNRCE